MEERRYKNCLEGYLTNACASCEFWRDGSPDENGDTAIGCCCPFPIDHCTAFHQMCEEEARKRTDV